MKQDCDICCGAGVIRLPRRRLSYRQIEPVAVVPADQGYLILPCPQCSDTVALARVAVLDTHCEVIQRAWPESEASVKEYAAMILAGQALKTGCITFKRSPLDERTQTFKLRGTLGVVTPQAVASMEQRVKERIGQFAERAIQEAEHRINSWGGHFGHDGLKKAQAIDSVREALKAALDTADRR